VGTRPPKFRLSTTPQKSPPLPRRSWLCRFNRLQSGVKFPFASVQDRLVVTARAVMGLAGAVAAPESALMTYLPKLALRAVLPFPNRSYATPTRGVMSFQFTDSTRSVVKSLFGASVPGPT
jgi:hypothetical protein